MATVSMATDPGQLISRDPTFDDRNSAVSAKFLVTRHRRHTSLIVSTSTCKQNFSSKHGQFPQFFHLLVGLAIFSLKVNADKLMTRTFE